MNLWKTIPAFLTYSVSDAGLVRNDDTGRIMAIRVNSRGISYVGMMQNGVQRNMSLARLVAEAFVQKPNIYESERFNTPIHLNGHRDDNTAYNLMWRPFWFAKRYQQQFTKGPTIAMPVIEQKTGQRYSCPFIAAMTFGLLEGELITAALNRSFVWPTFQEFRFAEE